MHWLGTQLVRFHSGRLEGREITAINGKNISSTEHSHCKEIELQKMCF